MVRPNAFSSHFNQEMTQTSSLSVLVQWCHCSGPGFRFLFAFMFCVHFARPDCFPCRCLLPLLTLAQAASGTHCLLPLQSLNWLPSSLFLPFLSICCIVIFLTACLLPLDLHPGQSVHFLIWFCVPRVWPQPAFRVVSCSAPLPILEACGNTVAAIVPNISLLWSVLYFISEVIFWLFFLLRPIFPPAHLGQSTRPDFPVSPPLCFLSTPTNPRLWEKRSPANIKSEELDLFLVPVFPDLS